MNKKKKRSIENGSNIDFLNEVLKERYGGKDISDKKEHKHKHKKNKKEKKEKKNKKEIEIEKKKKKL